MKKYTTHISVSALVIALGALGCTLFHNSHKDWDSAMFAVAMLSGLVMVLVGWNIYTLIDANRFKEDIRKNIVSLEERHETIKADFNQDILRINTIVFDSVSMSYKKVESNHNDFLYTFFKIRSISAYSQMNDADSAIKRIDDLLNVIPTFSPIENEDKSFLIGSLTKAESIQNKEYQEKMNLLNLALLEWGNNAN